MRMSYSSSFERRRFGVPRRHQCPSLRDAAEQRAPQVGRFPVRARLLRQLEARAMRCGPAK